MKTAIKYVVGSTWQPVLKKYLSKTRVYKYRNIELEIPSSVFHPGFFFSTHLLLDQVKKLSLQDKKLLEPGAGSGLISIYAAQHGAAVTASDINPVAVETLKRNSAKNNVSITTIGSDLFDNIPTTKFDIIAINPPYYRKNPRSLIDYAWNCGENGEYFKKLFAQLGNYIHRETKILMVLCDGCDVDMIESLARENSFGMDIIIRKENLIEKNFIYQIRLES